jgi:hypothetical protein
MPSFPRRAAVASATSLRGLTTPVGASPSVAQIVVVHARQRAGRFADGVAGG